MLALLLIGGLIALVGGADAFVRGASRLAAMLGIPAIIIGLTIVAIGTSAPEIGISVNAALAGSGDLAVGNVVGSNIFNALAILGLSALIVPLIVSHRIVRVDVPIMIALSLLALLLGLDGTISRIDGIVLLAIGVVYTGFLIAAARQPLAAPLPNDDFAREYRAPADRGVRAWLVNGLWIVGGLVALVLGSRWFIEGAVALADSLGVSQLVIGLTIVAVGTSLPEVATSIIASVRGERDIAVGNVIGSNIFNILLVLGASGLVAPDGLAVSMQVLTFDFPVMIAVAVACLPIVISGHRIDRWEGALFLVAYGLYVTWLVLGAVQGQGWMSLSSSLGVFVLPLLVLTAAILVWRWRHERGLADRGG